MWCVCVNSIDTPRCVSRCNELFDVFVVCGLCCRVMCLGCVDESFRG